MVKTIKDVHSKDICMFKIGNFYHVYGKDAQILSYLFGYKIKEIENNNKECGFPLNAINKVKVKLENFKINYLVIDRRNNYDVDENVDYKDLNTYIKYYEKANKYINIKRRIQNINEILLENIEVENCVEILREIENLIYERRKV